MTEIARRPDLVLVPARDDPNLVLVRGPRTDVRNLIDDCRDARRLVSATPIRRDRNGQYAAVVRIQPRQVEHVRTVPAHRSNRTGMVVAVVLGLVALFGLCAGVTVLVLRAIRDAATAAGDLVPAVVGVGLIAAAIWGLLGQTGHCPGWHCPGCKCGRGHR